MEALAPMLAVAAPEPFDAADYLFEVKWDGIRALSCRDERGWRLWGRQGADYALRYPELAVLEALPQGTLVDGEVVLLSQGVPRRACFPPSRSQARLRQRVEVFQPGERGDAYAQAVSIRPLLFLMVWLRPRR